MTERRPTTWCMETRADTLDEIRRLVAELPGPDLDSGTAAAQREALLTKPAGSLGRLEELAAWLAIWQGRHPPRIAHPRTSVFAANHGVAARGVSAYPAEVTAQMVQNFVNGGAAVNQLCRSVDADLRVYEMALDQPTADFTQGPAMTEAECARAMAYGMMAVEPGIDVLALGEMGIGNSTSAAALAALLFGGAGADWAGPGTGVSGEALRRKIDVVDAAIARHREGAPDPFEILRRVGGLELAAIAGAVIAARLARIPVLLDGFACTAAAAVVFAADKRAIDHCLVAHASSEPGHARLLERLGKAPLLDFGMRLGEGSGSTLAIAVLKAAVACHTDMATFAEAQVSGKSS
jgi:nicotinate-nucleotide--dimethylbenzimidazole phosphoribosyltransferase